MKTDSYNQFIDAEWGIFSSENYVIIGSSNGLPPALIHDLNQYLLIVHRNKLPWNMKPGTTNYPQKWIIEYRFQNERYFVTDLNTADFCR